MQTFYKNIVGTAFPKAIPPTLLVVEALLNKIGIPSMKVGSIFQVMPYEIGI